MSQLLQLINGSNINLIGMLGKLSMKVSYLAVPGTNNHPMNDNYNYWTKMSMFS